MSDIHKLVRGDTLPQVKLALTDEVTGAPINLTGASVVMNFRAAGDNVTLFTRAAYVTQQSAIDGMAYVQWQLGDLDKEAGRYDGEIVVIYPSGLKKTIDERIKFKLRESGL